MSIREYLVMDVQQLVCKGFKVYFGYRGSEQQLDEAEANLKAAPQPPKGSDIEEMDGFAYSQYERALDLYNELSVVDLVIEHPEFPHLRISNDLAQLRSQVFLDVAWVKGLDYYQNTSNYRDLTSALEAKGVEATVEHKDSRWFI